MLYTSSTDGTKESVNFDKIRCRIEKQCNDLNGNFVDPAAVTAKVIAGLYNGVTTQELDNLSAEICATMTTDHTDYAILAGRIVVSNLHKKTKDKFSGK